MKSKSVKDIIIICVLVVIILTGALFISNKLNVNTPNYSVLNRTNNGFSVFYDTLQELKYPVNRSIKNIIDMDAKDIQIVGYGENFDIEDTELKAWIGKGGVLIYAVPDNLVQPSYAGLPQVKNDVMIYNYQKGTIIVIDASKITNRALIKDTSYAYQVLNEINNYSYNNLFFNEKHLFDMQNTVTIWDYIPLQLKFVIYQVLIVIIVFLYYKGKRFGKARILNEEVERRENDYLLSAASLYRHAKCWDLMLESYYFNFVSGIGNYSEEWIVFWEREGLPHLDKANKVYKLMNNKGKKLRAKEYIRLITIIEELNNALKKRRELYWIKMKTTQ